MREALKETLWLRSMEWLRSLWAKPWAREAALCLGLAVVALVLSAAGLGGTPLPLAVALAAVCRKPERCGAVLLGMAAGSILFWGRRVGLEPIAAGLLVFAGRCIFTDLDVRTERWFYAMVAAVATAISGGVFLLTKTMTAALFAGYLARVLLAGGLTVGFRAGLQRSGGLSELLIGACILMGLGELLLPGGFSVGVIAAALLVSMALPGHRSTAAAVAFGLALDLALGTMGLMTAAFGLACLLCCSIRLPARGWTTALFCAAVAVCVLLGGGPLQVIPAAAVGSLLALVIPRRESLLSRLPGVEGRLRQGAEVLEQLYHMLTRQPPEAPAGQDAAVVFDKAAEKLCRYCRNYSACWEEQSAATYAALCTVAQPMMNRGAMLRSDLPDSFVCRCRHVEGFLQAVNQELDVLAYRRQFRARVGEARAIAAGQYRGLANFLRAAAEPETAAAGAYRWELGVSGRGKYGRSLSGDRGACFCGPHGQLYLLLCDGMGAGRAAAEESRAAVAALSGLLRAGAGAEDALALLNSAYTLRESGGFATVDLLEVNLESGEGILYKWGAASSYLKRGDRVRKIGTATLPPGFGVGETHAAQQTRLTLRGEEMVVLVSDGAIGEETEPCIAAYGGDSPAELADALLACRPVEDDMTAVVLRLCPVV